MVLSSLDEIRLKCFREMSIWLQNDWHAHVAKLPVDQRVKESDAISSDCKGYNVCDDTINYFIDPEE